MITRRPLLLSGLSLAATPALAQQQPTRGVTGAPRQPLVVAGRRSVLQRVLLRPGATIHARPNAPNPRDGIGFTAFYIYSRQGQGAEEWLEIGAAANGRPDGWVRTDRTLEWNHGMIAVFTNPAGRGRSLFLSTADQARALLRPGGAERAESLRAEVIAGRPADGVLAIEPDRYVDITRDFYLLPILRADMVEREMGGPVHVMEVASVPAERPNVQPATDDMLARFRAGLVFVVDTTTSMQPYIDRTREAMADVIARFGRTAVRDNFRFGVIGFRDSRQAQPDGFEYVSHIFARPDFNLPPEAAVEAMRGITATRANNTGFDEDPVAGLQEAIDQIDWNEFGGRYIVLITDAGARDGTDPLSTTGLGIAEIRQRAALRGITVLTIHLLTPEGRNAGNHPRARQQYQALTASPAGSLYYPVEDGSVDRFRATVSALVEGILGLVAETTGRPIAELRSPGAQAPTPAAERMQQQLRVVAEAMRLAYLGREAHAQVPDVFRSFVLSLDPAPPGNRAVEVRVMLTRNQLSDLSQALTEILRAGRSDRIDDRALFRQLQTALTLAARDPTRIARPGTLGQLLGEWLEGLPYRSPLMEMTEDDWLTLGGSGQTAMLNAIETKLRLYRAYNSDSNLWRSLSGQRDAGTDVFPVPLSDLP